MTPVLAPGASPADLLPAPGPSSDLATRVVRLMVLRTLVITVVLGLSFWLTATSLTVQRTPLFLQLAVIIASYASSIFFAALLARNASPTRIAHAMLATDLVLTSLLIFVTGGALSPYTFLFALSIVSAGAVSYRRGAIAVAGSSLVLAIGVSLLAWAHAIDMPLTGSLQPWQQTGVELVRSLGVNVAALIGVGALAIIFGEQLERGAETLATTRRAAADLLTLHHDIVRSLSSGLITTDPNGSILTANHVAAEILGRPQDSLVGLAAETAMPGIAGLLTENRSRLELSISTPNRSAILGVSISQLRDVHNQPLGRVINFQDLTELRRLELHSRRAERLATVGQFAAGIAHEIRNPLAAISGSIELLRTSPQMSEDDRTLMAIVNREIVRLNGLIGELLDYANPRPAVRVDFDLGALTHETLQVARSEAAFSEIELTMDVDQPLLVHADPAKLGQVVWNLIRNAGDAAMNGGKHVRIEAHRRSREVIVAVTDDGPGIPKEVLAHIFDPFVTTKQKGTGLGLATSHAVIAEHGGRIDVETAATGTRMIVTLPAPQGATPHHGNAVGYERT